MKKSTHKVYARADKPARDIYQEVTDRIVAALEKGAAPWKRPWRLAQGIRAGLPVNALTGNAYQGINVLLLWLSAAEQGFGSDLWLTYRQAQQLGGHVRKGEVATDTVIFKPLKVPAKDRNGDVLRDERGEVVMTEVPMIKANSLFHVSQCDELPAHFYANSRIPDEEIPGVPLPDMHRAQALLNASGVKVTNAAQNQAYYSPLNDRIVMPLPSQFDREADYWATLLHELVHSTGHKSRLNREGITSSSRKFGDPAYSFEELIAEMGSAFLCAQLGVQGEVNHESYLQCWLQVLKADKKALFRAATQARIASEFLLTAAGQQRAA
ncbi:ArdC family protein [Providencia rettgeri]